MQKGQICVGCAGGELKYFFIRKMPDVKPISADNSIDTSCDSSIDFSSIDKI